MCAAEELDAKHVANRPDIPAIGDHISGYRRGDLSCRTPGNTAWTPARRYPNPEGEPDLFFPTRHNHPGFVDPDHFVESHCQAV